MSARSQTLTFETLVRVKLALVYRAFTNSTSLREWFCDVATVDPKPGGRMYVAWSDGYYASGEYLETRPGKRVSFSWQGRGDPRPSRVTVRLVKKDGGTLVRIEHSRLANMLQAHRAGDRVEVGFYRGSERKSVTMVLSKRPLPDIPSLPETLAAEIRKRDENSFSELAEAFAGVSEEEAAHKPVKGAWSAKEVLAHLIHERRGNLSFIDDLVGGYEPLYDDYGPNLECRLIATLAAIPTLAGMLEEYRRLSDKAASLIEALPDSFLENKGSYWRIAHNFLKPDYHLYSHLDQMREAIADARKR